MNDVALAEYISQKLKTNVNTYDTNGQFLNSYCRIHNFQDTIITQNNLEDTLLDFSKDLFPKMVSVNNIIYYASIYTTNKIYLVGPFRFFTPITTHIQFTDFNTSKEFIKQFSSFGFHEIMNDILLIFNLHANNPISLNELINLTAIDDNSEDEVLAKYTNTFFHNQEENTGHNPYDQELRVSNSIENGNLKQLERSIKEDYSGKLGILADNPTRQAKNLCISVIILASRAAIRGGVNPEISFTLCDHYIQEIENSTNLANAPYLTYKAQKKYTELVAAIKNINGPTEGVIQNPYITECKKYVLSNLHEKITIKDIADSFHINSNYLSDLFKKHEGKSLSTFIMEEKINYAQHLLIYTDLSFSDIATSLGYSSQSHLGKYFKKLEGMTPKDYRDKYGIKRFKRCMTS